MELEKLKFELQEKEDELAEIRKDIFVFNPRFAELLTEIEDLKDKINEMEDNSNARRECNEN